MPRSRAHASAIDPHAVLLEAGQHAAFGAAFVGLLAAGGTVISTSPPRHEAPAAPATADLQEVDLAAIEAALNAPSVASEALSATPVVFNVPTHLMQPLVIEPALPPATTPSLASEVAFRDEVLNLYQPSLFSSPESELSIETGARVRAPESMSARLENMADQLSYEAPADEAHDIAVFVAADDEAVSWTLNASSPNFGGLAYEEDRVEMGDLAAGVALTTDDVRIAAAYVERDMDMRLGRGFEDRDQRYAGVIVTFKN